MPPIARRASCHGAAASSRSRTAATIAAPSARSGRRAGQAGRCRSKRSATRSRAKSTAARRRSCSPASTSPTMPAAWARSASACSPPSRASAPAPVVARQHRDRRRSVRADRRRAAADAALPSVASGGRRHDPEAHEAPPQPRRRGSHGRAHQGGSAGATIGADLIAGFPTETEDMALNTPEIDRRLRHRRGAHLPLLAAARHARRAHAAAAARAGQGPRRAPAGSRGATPRGAGSTASSARRQPVLIEGDGKGHSDNFAPVAHRRRDPRRHRPGPHHRPRRRPSDRPSGHELARPPARRLRQDRREGRRQSHRPHQPRRARHRHARRHRGSADRLRSRPRGIAPHPRGDRRQQVRAARRARPSHDPCRGDREDPRAGRQAAGNQGLSRART